MEHAKATGTDKCEHGVDHKVGKGHTNEHSIDTMFPKLDHQLVHIGGHCAALGTPVRRGTPNETMHIITRDQSKLRHPIPSTNSASS